MMGAPRYLDRVYGVMVARTVSRGCASLCTFQRSHKSVRICDAGPLLGGSQWHKVCVVLNTAEREQLGAIVATAIGRKHVARTPSFSPWRIDTQRSG